MARTKSFYSHLFTIALPIILQNAVSTSLNLLDVVMIGQMGEVAIAGVGLANQIYFILILMLFGVSSGAGLFTAQLWGKQDTDSIHKVQGLGLVVGLIGSTLFAILAIFFPFIGLGIFTSDPSVLMVGSGYLRIIGFSYFFIGISSCYTSVLKSTGNVRIPMAVSMVALSLKTILSYLLIFGRLGFPMMGVAGAALGTTIARCLECLLLIGISYRYRLPSAARLRELLSFTQQFARRFFAIALPVVFNETFWAVGVSIYTAVYAHISTEAIAAVNIASTIENMAFVLFFGMADALAIIVGHEIGKNEHWKAFEYARKTLVFSTITALLVGGVLISGSDRVLSLYKVSPLVHIYARNILAVISGALWVKSSNMLLIVGILRSGGDTRFGFILDAGSVWLVGIPLALIGAFVLHLPVYWVYLMVMCEEVAKYLIGLFRFASRRWINNVVQDLA